MGNSNGKGEMANDNATIAEIVEENVPSKPSQKISRRESIKRRFSIKTQTKPEKPPERSISADVGRRTAERTTSADVGVFLRETSTEDRRASSKSSMSMREKKRNSSVEKYDKPAKKEEGPLSAAHKEFIQTCWDAARTVDLGNRVFQRVIEKRPDVTVLRDNFGRERWYEEGRKFTLFIETIIRNLANIDEVKRLATEHGEMHVDWRPLGFKPDFWVTMADAMTTECLYLDEGVHPPAEVIESWGSLITFMFSAMRDGYYDRLRRDRRASKRLQRQNTTASSQESSNLSINIESIKEDIVQNGGGKKSTAVIISDFFE